MILLHQKGVAMRTYDLRNFLRAKYFNAFWTKYYEMPIVLKAFKLGIK